MLLLCVAQEFDATEWGDGWDEGRAGEADKAEAGEAAEAAVGSGSHQAGMYRDRFAGTFCCKYTLTVKGIVCSWYFVLV